MIVRLCMSGTKSSAAAAMVMGADEDCATRGVVRIGVATNAEAAPTRATRAVVRIFLGPLGEIYLEWCGESIVATDKDGSVVGTR